MVLLLDQHLTTQYTYARSRSPSDGWLARPCEATNSYEGVIGRGVAVGGREELALIALAWPALAGTAESSGHQN